MTMTETTYQADSPEIQTLLGCITLKKLKTYEAMSEETNAFIADLYILSKKVAICSNRGHGDPIGIHILDDEARDRADALDAKAKHWTMYTGTRPDGSTFTMTWDLEMLIGAKVEEMMMIKWEKARSRTMVLVEASDGKTSTYKRRIKVSDKAMCAREEERIIIAAKEDNPGWTRIYGLRSIEGGEIVRS